MHVLICLIDLVGWAILILAALWVILFVLGMFFPAIGPAVIWPLQPGQPIQGAGRFVILIYLFIGLVLLANLLGCLRGQPLLPELWPMR